MIKKIHVRSAREDRVGDFYAPSDGSATAAVRESSPSASVPTCVFIGDFNVGKSALINAIIREDLMPTAMEESTRFPALITRQARGDTGRFVAIRTDGTVEPLTQRQFTLRARAAREESASTVALLARVPAMPFGHIRLIDSPGLSSTSHHGWRGLLDESEASLAVIVVDVEYWAAKHSMELLTQVQAAFANVALVANKADHLNRHEIARVCESAPKRLRAAGARRVPVFTVSASLERGRGFADDELRAMTKNPVLVACDSGFDALRLFFYEWESRFASPASDDNLFAWARSVQASSNQ
jgi:GTP-binding protein EngB required for normal cell division